MELAGGNRRGGGGSGTSGHVLEKSAARGAAAVQPAVGTRSVGQSIFFDNRAGFFNDGGSAFRLGG